MPLCPDEPIFEFVEKPNLPYSALRPLQSLTGGARSDLDGIPTFNLQGGETLPVLVDGSIQWRSFDLNPPTNPADIAPIDNPNARWIVAGGL